MENEDVVRKAIAEMSLQAERSGNANDAMKFSQAAFNLAHVLSVMNEIDKGRKE